MSARHPLAHNPLVNAKPKKPKRRVRRDPVDVQAEAASRLAADMPENPNTPREFGYDDALAPTRGKETVPADRTVTASTLSEDNASAKTGAAATTGANAMDGSLARVRVDSGGQTLTTNQGVAIADNQHSLRVGLRGPTLLEDFILREKITHFDHERIPERIVHARGSAAHGVFEAYESLDEFTRAAPFAEAGKQTPVFARFSTVAGERGSFDTARDARGFAVKFYTDEGNWDLVGNNIPVFFIQDSMKFPDLVHALKPEPHHAMPQAQSAHDTFWDFVSLMPESTHMLTWVMSDRGIPRSYRMMQGFGVNTFRFINAEGMSHFVKFHWTPMLGTHSLVWDEAMKLGGADPDYHRRDLWEAIERGEYPEWELGVQLITESEAEQFSFDILDATKIIPEELVPVRPVGRMVLNRNPDNFFAETEQAAFCTAHVVPGIDFSNDPLLAGRIHSYVDTQISRLGGPNFHEIPINAPLASVHNNQRDGMHRQAVPRGRVAYEPNSLGGGCPFQAGSTGFISFPEPVAGDKLRGKPEKFAEHYNQARLFYDSQTVVEQRHMINAFRFELSKVTVPAIRERMVASLANVHPELAAGVADGLGIAVPAPLSRATQVNIVPEVLESNLLSLHAHPGDGGIRTRQIAILAGNGADGASVALVRSMLDGEGAVCKLVSVRLGDIATSTGEALAVDRSLEMSPSVLFDAVVVADGQASIEALLYDGHTREFMRDIYRHCKTILTLGVADQLLIRCDVPTALENGEPDPGIIADSSANAEQAITQFITAVGKHRHPERDSDPPLI